MENSQQSAFGYGYANEQSYQEVTGLTKREYFAGLAMQGWIACQTNDFKGKKQDCIKRSIEWADELLKQLESL